jgi:hypothetical protein
LRIHRLLTRLLLLRLLLLLLLLLLLPWRLILSVGLWLDAFSTGNLYPTDIKVAKSRWRWWDRR